MLSCLRHELQLFFEFSWRDWSVTIIPSFLYAARAARVLHEPLSTIFFSYIFLSFWVASFLYTFTLLNQISGVDEDRANKPDRPIPSGRITIEGAIVRCFTSVTLLLALAFTRPSILQETITWIGTALFLSFSSAGQHWFWKNNACLTVGAWSFFSATWKIIVPPTSPSHDHPHYILAIALWFGLGTHIQDLRDIKGDARRGRKTLPLVFKEKESRMLMSFVFIPLQILALWIDGVLQLAPVAIYVAHIFLAWRVLQTGKGPKYDHKTYMYWTYVFCFLVTLISTAPMA